LKLIPYTVANKFRAETFIEMQKKGQIATHYCSPEGIVTTSPLYNPNGSYFAIEGISSPDGRVFGKMGHSERIGKGLYKNIYDIAAMNQRIFESGVEYFS